MHTTTINFFFISPTPTASGIQQLLTEAGIPDFTYTSFAQGDNSWTFTADRALTSAEISALQAAIMASLVTVTST